MNYNKELDLLEDYMKFYIDLLPHTIELNKPAEGVFSKHQIDSFEEFKDGYGITYGEKHEEYVLHDGEFKKVVRDFLLKNEGSYVRVFTKTYRTFRYTGIEWGVEWTVHPLWDCAFFKRNSRERLKRDKIIYSNNIRCKN
jgi:hypothetical protein